MRPRSFRRAGAVLAVVLASGLVARPGLRAADHNDPNSANSIFSDIQVSPADLYDLFGFPVEDGTGERVFVALTFASVPQTGVLDPDLLYRVRMYPSARVAPTMTASGEQNWQGMAKYFDAVKDKYLHAKPAEVRVTVDAAGRATVAFMGFAGGTFTETIDTNKVADL
ncbi:MAG TPA: hypothetical protein VF310_17785, partial [Vicinamibacteria bacterium]